MSNFGAATESSFAQALSTYYLGRTSAKCGKIILQIVIFWKLSRIYRLFWALSAKILDFWSFATV